MTEKFCDVSFHANILLQCAKIFENSEAAVLKSLNYFINFVFIELHTKHYIVFLYFFDGISQTDKLLLFVQY